MRNTIRSLAPLFALLLLATVAIATVTVDTDQDSYTVTDSWDTGNNPDVAGGYGVRVNILNETITAEYILTGGVGVETSSWGAVKSLYRD